MNEGAKACHCIVTPQAPRMRTCQQASLIGRNQFCWVSRVVAFECGSCHPQEGILGVRGGSLVVTVSGMSSGLQRDARYPTVRGAVSQGKVVPVL